jgi:hypothetical protein
LLSSCLPDLKQDIRKQSEIEPSTVQATHPSSGAQKLRKQAPSGQEKRPMHDFPDDPLANLKTELLEILAALDELDAPIAAVHVQTAIDLLNSTSER